MKKTIGMVIFCMMLLLNCLTVMAAETDPIVGNMTVDGTNVTVVMSGTAEWALTNGKVQVTYDTAKYELVSAEAGEILAEGIVDINQDTPGVVSLAWAMVEAVTLEEETPILVVKLTLKDIDAEKVEVGVVLAEMYDAEGEVEAMEPEYQLEVELEKEPESDESESESESKPEDETKPSQPSQPSQPTQPSQPSQPDQPSQGQNSATGDEAPVGRLVLTLGMAAAAVIGLLVLKKRKTV